MRDGGAIHANKCSFRTPGSPVDSASYQFLASAGFAQKQNSGVGTGHLVDLAKYLAECFRRADDVLEHRITIDLLSQRDVFVPRSFFRPDAVINVCAGCIPSSDLSAPVAKRIVLNQIPAILTVLPECSMLEFQRNTPREGSLSVVAKSFHVLRMKDSFSKIGANTSSAVRPV